VQKQPPRAVSKHESDFDLTPPEEIRARRIKRFVLLGALVACVLGAGIYFCARPVGGAIKAWQSRRLAREAFAFIEQGKWSDANAKARDAYLLRPTEPEVWRAIAQLASRTNQWSSALEMWKKVDEAGRLTREDRREYVGAALAAGEVALAAKQVRALMSQAAPASGDLIWAAQVAKRQSDPELALDYAERVLADSRAKPYEIASAATLVLSLTSPSSQRYAEAWKRVEDVARDLKNPASLSALILLANENAVPPRSAISNTSLSLESSGTPKPAEEETSSPSPTPLVLSSVTSGVDTSPRLVQSTLVASNGDSITLDLAATSATSAGRTMTLNEVADALENHPDARPAHKLLALEVRARQHPGLTDQYVADAVQRFGNATRLVQTDQGGADLADETLLALATWLNRIGRPAKTLDVLPEGRATQRQDLFLQYMNALAALQRWTEMKDLLLKEHSVVDPMVQHMYLAVTQAHLGSATSATNEWQRALQVAGTPEKLMTVAGNAEQNSILDVADAAYSEAIKSSPMPNRGAYAGRLRVALATGKTAQAQTIAAEIARLWPDDAAARNQDAYLQLLLGASGPVAEAAERDAQLLVAQEPQNWQARATLGLACLRLGRNQKALGAYRGIIATGEEPPGALAVRAVILSANGYNEGARNDALLLAAKPLLPEERALIAQLLQ
jgi:hypothetical protein